MVADGRASRRSLLKGLALFPSAAAALTVVRSSGADAYDPGPEEMRARYRETEDVKAFYRTNGYETLKKK